MSRNLSQLASVSILAMALAGVAAPVAHAAPPAGAKPAPPPQQRIANPGYFDVGLCSAKPPAVPAKLTANALGAVLLAARPQLSECLVPAKARGNGKETSATIQVTLTGADAVVKVTGENLGDAAAPCFESTVKAWLAGIDGLAAKAGKAPVVAETTVQHLVGISPAEQAGVSESSDLVASTRLAQKSWCDCYAPWQDASASPLRATVKVTAGKAVEVKFDAAADATAGKVAACLTDKLKAHAFPSFKTTYVVPVVMPFVNSGSSKALVGAAGDLRFQQGEMRRAQLVVGAVLAVESRQLASAEFNALVTQLKKKKKVDKAKLAAACQAVVAADDAWVAAAEAVQAEEEALVQLVGELKAKDAGWTQAFDGVSGRLGDTKKETETAKATRTSDAAACPK